MKTIFLIVWAVWLSVGASQLAMGNSTGSVFLALSTIWLVLAITGDDEKKKTAV